MEMLQICATFRRKLDLRRQTMPPFLHLIAELQKLFLPMYFYLFFFYILEQFGEALQRRILKDIIS